MQIGGAQWTALSIVGLHSTSMHCARVSLLKMRFDIFATFTHFDKITMKPAPNRKRLIESTVQMTGG